MPETARSKKRALPADGDPSGASAQMADWFKDRIKEFKRIPAEQILPNEKNPRRHGPDQKFAMRGLLDKVGYVDALIVRELGPDHYQLLDGHMRLDLCPEATALPALVVDVTDEEADLILATHDQVGAMAILDEELADILATSAWTDDQSINTVLRTMVAWESDKDKVTEKQQVLQNQLDLAPLPYEHYDYVMILARSTMDFDRLCALLKIQKMDFQSPGGVHRIGTGRCLDAGAFLALVEEMKL